MKQNGFKRAPMREATQSTYTPKPRPQAVAAADAACMVVQVPKDRAVRSETYRRLVAAMPCACCGKAGPSQAAHSDFGKGLALKSDDRTCFPACVECHVLIGSSGTFTREERRKAERLYGAKTRAAIFASGGWPATVPLWSDA